MNKNRCCNDRENYSIIVNSERYDSEGNVIKRKVLCKICGYINNIPGGEK